MNLHEYICIDIENKITRARRSVISLKNVKVPGE